MKNLILFSLFSIFSLTLFAHRSNYMGTGNFDVRLLTEDISCSNADSGALAKLVVTIQVKASNHAGTFNISEQNYRFSFNRGVIANPVIEQELALSHYVSHNLTQSLYTPHTLTGTRDTIVSYNVELAGGDGYPLTDSIWVSVGQVAFDVLDMDGCIDLTWHTHSPTHFPPTFIGQKSAGHLFEAREGDYFDASFCVSDFIPIAEITQEPNQLCTGQTGTFIADTGLGMPNTIYLWSVTNGTPSSSTQSSIEVLPNSSGTVRVDLLVARNGCPPTLDMTSIMVEPTPNLNLATANHTICPMGANHVTIGNAPEPNITYLWTPNTGLSDPYVSNPIAFPTTTTTYTVQATSPNSSCIATANTTVSIDTWNVTAGGDVIVCDHNSIGAEIGATSQSNVAYSWTPRAGLSDPNISNPIARPNGSVDYQLTATNLLTGCIVIDTAKVTFEVDVTPPGFMPMPTQMVEPCDRVPSASNVIATDNCGIDNVVFEETTTVGCPSIIHRTWTATDNAGLVSTFAQDITIIDTVAPVFLNAPADLDVVVSCDDQSAIDLAINKTPSFNDCGLGSVDTIYTMVETGAVCDNNQLKMQYIRSWTLVDLCGNQSDPYVQYITITSPGPYFTTQPYALDRYVGNDTDALNDALALSPDIYDNCFPIGQLILTTTDVMSISDDCGMNTVDRVRTWTYADSCGMTSSVYTQTITMEAEPVGGINTCGNDIYEPNNSTQTATSLNGVLGTAGLRRTYICPQGDEDYFYFSVPAGGKVVHISLEGLPADYDLELHNNSYVQLANSINTCKNSETIEETLGEGDYMIKVHAKEDIAWSPTQPYILKLNMTNFGVPNVGVGNGGTKDPITTPYLPSNPVIPTNPGGVKDPFTNPYYSKTATLETLSVYPNPTKNQLFVDIPTKLLNTENVQLQIVDLNGRVLRNENITITNRISVNTSDYSNGAYILRLNSNNLTYQNKFIVLRN